MKKIAVVSAMVCWMLIVLLGGCLRPCSSPAPESSVKTLARNEVPAAISYASEDPGESERLPRGHAFAPPMIPHNIDGMEIVADENPCLGCHEEGIMDAPKIPESHFADLATGADRKELHMSRWSCTLCHAPQAEVEPLVENVFEE